MPPEAIEKAEAAYRVISPLSTAVQKFQADGDFRFRCYENLVIDKSFRAPLIDGIYLLAIDLGLARTQRTISETGDVIDLTLLGILSNMVV